MASYRQRIEAAIAPLFACGFTITCLSEAPQSFGNTEIVIALLNLRARFISDRGQLFVDVAGPLVLSPWHDLSEVLTTVGVHTSPGPWQTAEAAVSALRQHDATILRWLRESNLQPGR